MKNLNNMKMKRNDILQQRADALESAAKHYEAGNMTAYQADMDKVKGYNTELETMQGLISEMSKEYGDELKDFSGGAQKRNSSAGTALVDTVRSTEKYAEAWITALIKGYNRTNSMGVDALAPLFEAETASKAMSISGGDPVGEDGGFLVPIDFDNKIVELTKEYIDLSPLVTVEHVSSNTGWRVVESADTRTPLTKVAELGSLAEKQKPTFTKVQYNCAKYGDKVIVSNELMQDYSGIIDYLARWFAPKYVLTKNSLILSILNALPFKALEGATDAEQIKALKTCLNTGLNTGHSKSAVILTNGFGYNAMDSWADANGRPLLVPDLKNPGFNRFQNRPVHYGDLSEIPNVQEDAYYPMYVGNLKALVTLFLRKGFRMDSTNVGGQAWDTYSTEIRCACRMDAQKVDGSAALFAGIAAQQV